jgi:hypothetical protein
MNSTTEYMNQLKLSAKLAGDYERSMKTRATQETYNIEPLPNTRTLAEEQEDEQFQLRLALQNLQGIMLPQEADDVVNQLSKDDIYELNSNIARIKTELRGRKNISSAFFLQFFDRFKQLIASTDDTGLEVPPQDQKRLTPKKKVSFKDEYPELSDKNIRPEVAMTLYRNLRESGDLDKLNIKQARDLVKAIDINFKIAKKVDIIPTLEAVFGKGDDEGRAGGSSEGTGFSKGKKKLPDEINYKKQLKIREPSKLAKHFEKKIGRGLGVDEKSKIRFQKFGKYYISTHVLETKNSMSFRYPSLAQNRTVESRRVSDDFKEMFLDLLENGILNKYKFNELSDDEQQYLMKIAQQCQADIGVKLKSSTKEQDDMKRFDILRGELGAGNTATIPELKKYLFQFGKEGKISKRDMFEILHEIVALG